jgi:hypothetical protein
MPVETSSLRARGRWRFAAAALTFILILAVPGVAGARSMALSFAPEPAVWTETLTVTVHAQGCDLALGPFQAFGTPGTYEASLTETCATGQTPASTSASGTIDLPGPGEYTIRVRDVDFSSVSRRVSVHDASAIGIEAPEVVVAGEPFDIGLTFRAGCSGIGAERKGSVIEVTVHPGCLFPIPEPPAAVRQFDLAIQPLPVGTYELLVLDYTNGFTSSSPSVARRTIVARHEDRCFPGPDVLCLHDGRFRVTAEWTDFDGDTGVGHPLELAGNDTSGLMWFFSPDNVELTVKVLDGCALNDHWWVFLSSGSNVHYTLTVMDTETGISRSWENPSGELPELIPDTTALEVCP